MKIGIDASRAFLKKRTGIEEYSYQVIKHLRGPLADKEVILYLRKKFHLRSFRFLTPEIDFDLPLSWRVRGIWAPRFWTQIGLSLEMLLYRPDVLFVPAHVVPLIHPQHTVVTVHGLEYEFCPKSYSWWDRFYMRHSIKFSVRAASHVIAVSGNTKDDLTSLYGVPEEKMTVVHEGVFGLNEESNPENSSSEFQKSGTKTVLPMEHSPYFLFIGRLEERKNLSGIIKAFELFKAKTNSPHKLVLVGKPGYGYEQIQTSIQESKFRESILESGYVTEPEKWIFLQNAVAFLFPSHYEGFGLPILEAQMVGTPVITSNTSSLPEVAGEGGILVGPNETKKIAKAMQLLATDDEKRADIIKKATKNVDRFSWMHCAREVAELLINGPVKA